MRSRRHSIIRPSIIGSDNTISLFSALHSFDRNSRSAAESSAAPGECATLPTTFASETQSVLPLSYVQSLPGKSVSIYSQPGDTNIGTVPRRSIRQDSFGSASRITSPYAKMVSSGSKSIPGLCARYSHYKLSAIAVSRHVVTGRTR
jgi:hypothetical protein